MSFLKQKKKNIKRQTSFSQFSFEIPRRRNEEKMSIILAFRYSTTSIDVIYDSRPVCDVQIPRCHRECFKCHALIGRPTS